ncbi:hypothetical protein [Alloprevotella tannerae]|uniref:hypothetical protein n=1 Tax=Alloprevotella tannerae TaxID=76122 RepID=UPI0028EDBBB7|nr:hypothetical protein [Alloprevotella tannerae]
MRQLDKKTKGDFLALLLTLPLLFTGCGKTSNYGYPSNVNFSNEGGSKEIKGNDSPYLLGIADDDGNGEAAQIQQDGDSMNISYQWLTIKAKKGESKFTLIAQPKQGGGSRTLRVYAGIDPTDMDNMATIKVVQ